ncbi:ABC transporter permease [Laceyella putida]|uniref:Transport permease protein n=1 Tax=Laceyella putida TaxID=110101 RepID=A0ABW2RLQ9_9BACL
MWRRIGALIRKEFIQLKRDRRTLAMLIVLPVLWLVAFGYAVNFDVNVSNVMIVDQARNEAAGKAIKQMEKNGDLRIVEREATQAQGEEALKQGTTDAVILIPKAYDLSPDNADEQLRIWVDGSRLFSAQSVVRELNEALGDLQQENMEEMKEQMEAEWQQAKAPEVKLDLGGTMIPPQVASQVKEKIETQLSEQLNERQEEQKARLTDQLPNPDFMAPEIEVRYNEDLKSVYHMIPGLMGLVLIFITTLMTALGVVKEKERGTLEQLVVSPLRSVELILGKLLPYMIIATLDFFIVFAVGTWVFQVPFTGDLFSYLLVALLFLFASLGLGLFVSTVSETQQQAMQLAVLTLVPQFILSGFVFPLEAMPEAIRWIAYVMPLTYFLPISRDVFLKGMSAWDHPLPFAMLAFFALLFLLIATIRFKRSLA